MKLRGAASKLRRGTLKLRGRGTWLGAGAVALAVPAMFFSRRFARLLFEHHDDALIALQWMPGVGALLGSLASRRKSGPPPRAFTGAEARKRGRFEHADGGTLLLDEVGELPPELQPKLLHVLQDGEFFRIGGAQPIRCDARVMAATNRDLESAVEASSARTSTTD